MTQVKQLIICSTNFKLPPDSVGFCYDTNDFILQGKGEFTMEYLEHSQVSQDVQTQLVNTHKATKSGE